MMEGARVTRWRRLCQILLVIMANVRPSSGNSTFPEFQHQEAVSSLAISQNNFTRDMYVKLAKENSGNLFFSPFSIISALGMTLGGARGNTKAEMHKVLHLEDNDSIHDAFSDIIADIKTEVPEYELQTANMVYVSDQLKVLDEYMELLTQKYMSSAETVDFNQEAEVRGKINGAVEDATKSRIKDLIPPGILDSLTRMVLVNAVYFKGLWEHQFSKESTYDEDFWTSASSSVKVPMMHIKKKFGYSVNDELGASLLRMNYQGSRLSMVIVLPNERDGLAALEEKLATADLNELDKRMYNVEVEVTLPKFKLEESLDLGDHLSGMGMVDLFSEKDADLSGISGNKDLFVSKVLHKAFLEVNEEGSEAAAATAVVIRARCMVMNEIFNANHPFAFFMRDEATGFVLFAGRLTEMGQNIQKDEL
ncbi:leukocyte elastase inhibitor A-like isoform X1 [Macrobrachium nipponense]|uniref:leukocyte elastase inhibitor A-like isoform X1 n=2 Tax=Macrobrachium nipponense TaxID=159736 RepID=UPI0030C8094F